MDSKYLVKVAAQACEDKKAVNTQMIKISKVSNFADWILISRFLGPTKTG